MTTYGPPAVPRSPASPVQRAALLFYVAGGLGFLSFVWGFLKWFTEGSGPGQIKIGGYAAGSPVVAVIAFSLAAGLLAAAGAWEKKPATLTPVVLAVTSVLVAIGVLIGKNSISSSDGNPKYGIGIGFILALVTIVLQTGVLVVAWMTANGRMPATAAPAAWPAQPQQAYSGQQSAYPAQAAQPGSYGPPQTYGPPAQQQPQPGPTQAYGPPQVNPGYGPPPGQ